MAGTRGVHFQLQEEDEIQHRDLRRYCRYVHHLFHADKRFEGQLIHDSRQQTMDTGQHGYADRFLFYIFHDTHASTALAQNQCIQSSGFAGYFRSGSRLCWQ